MEQTKLDDLIAKNHLQPIAGDIHSLLKESIRLTALPARSSDTLTERSHLGGQPYLPEQFTWPVWHDKPMAFIAQIRLADIARFAPAQALPSTGLLSFFYDAAQDTYGDSPGDRGGWSVIYFTSSVTFRTAEFPANLPQQAQYQPMPVEFQSEWTLPVDPQAAAGLNWDSRQQHHYEKLLQQFQKQENAGPPRHRMFGWPDQIQDDLHLQAAMMSSGVTDINDPRAKAAEKNKADWQLLLQVDSDEQAGMRWASSGLLYFLIETEKLKDRQFDQTWLILQSE